MRSCQLATDLSSGNKPFSRIRSQVLFPNAVAHRYNLALGQQAHGGAMAKRRKEGLLNQQLRAAIAGSGLSLNQLGKKCQVAASQLSRFVRGQRDLTTTAAGRVCEALGLKLAPGKAKKGK